MEMERMHSAAMLRLRSPQDLARDLLERHLNAAQLAEFRQKGCFRTRGGTSGRLYHIYNLAQNNVLDGKYRMCAVLVSCPIHDQMLAQKLMIEHHEDDFRRIAVMQRADMTVDDWHRRRLMERIKLVLSCIAAVVAGAYYWWLLLG